MNILIVSDNFSLSHGGLETQIYTNVCELEKLGDEVKVMYEELKSPKEQASKITPYAIPLRPFLPLIRGDAKRLNSVHW